MKIGYRNCCLMAALAVMVVTIHGKENGVNMTPHSSNQNEATTPKVSKTRHGRELTFARRSYCRKTSDMVYNTVKLTRLQRLSPRARRDRTGNCANLCTELCAHAPCMSDYVVAGSTCECAKATPKQCVPNAVCIPSTDACACKPGFAGSATTECADIDECKATPPVCGIGLICTNTIGSYTCATTRSPQATPVPSPIQAPKVAPVTKTPTVAPVTKSPTVVAVPPRGNTASPVGAPKLQAVAPVDPPKTVIDPPKTVTATPITAPVIAPIVPPMDVPRVQTAAPMFAPKTSAPAPVDAPKSSVPPPKASVAETHWVMFVALTEWFPA